MTIEKAEVHEYNPTIQRDFLLSLLAEKLGHGVARQVFAVEKLFDDMPDLVVKVEDGDRAFQNVVEWDMWQEVRSTKWKKWFAPVEWISQNGAVLLMRRTTVLLPREYPPKMPQFFTDFKRANYGRYNNRVVCHDYGSHMATTWGLSDRMKKIEWWD